MWWDRFVCCAETDQQMRKDCRGPTQAYVRVCVCGGGGGGQSVGFAGAISGTRWSVGGVGGGVRGYLEEQGAQNFHLLHFVMILSDH